MDVSIFIFSLFLLIKLVEIVETDADDSPAPFDSFDELSYQLRERLNRALRRIGHPSSFDSFDELS
jgi:hypothetical protein